MRLNGLSVIFTFVVFGTLGHADECKEAKRFAKSEGTKCLKIKDAEPRNACREKMNVEIETRGWQKSCHEVLIKLRKNYENNEKKLHSMPRDMRE